MLSLSTLADSSFAKQSTRASTTDLRAKSPSRGNKQDRPRGKRRADLFPSPLHPHRRASSDCCLHRGEREVISASTTRSPSPLPPGPDRPTSQGRHNSLETKELPGISKGSIPEIYISQDNTSSTPHSSSTSSSPHSLENYLHTLNGEGLRYASPSGRSTTSNITISETLFVSGLFCVCVGSILCLCLVCLLPCCRVWSLVPALLVQF